LKRLIAVITTHVVWDWIVLVLTSANENDFIVVHIGIAALPMLAELERSGG
jgi:hypothetical protein